MQSRKQDLKSKKAPWHQRGVLALMNERKNGVPINETFDRPKDPDDILLDSEDEDTGC